MDSSVFHSWGVHRAAHADVFLFRFRYMVRLEKVELNHSVDEEKGSSQHPPHSNVARERLGDGGPSKLDADEQLSDNDGQHDPGLPAKPVTLWIIKKLKSFSQA